MKILTVTYRTNKNLGNYETAHVEATAQVQKNETPEEALEKLVRWVHEQLGDAS